MSAPIITIENLGKRYRVKKPNTSGGTGLRHALEAGARNLWNGLGRMAKGQAPFDLIPPDEEFWALKDVSLEIQQGECVGIIGRNGAGKSTLLKILSRITEPSAGRAVLRGRVGSLLEVGTGFHPELTGRENIFLNGSILGMRRHEILRRMDEIVAFAEVDDFLDTPVRFYSSGMYMRLAFSVAAHLDPDILIVDEVLAVGDVEFQKKCLGKMSEVAKQGRTVLFVSHNIQAIRQLCNKALHLLQGRAAHAGCVEETLAKYLVEPRPYSHVVAGPHERRGTGEYRFVHASVAQPVFGVAERKRVLFRIEHRQGHLKRLFLSGQLFDANGTLLAQFDSRLLEVMLGDSPVIEGEFGMDHPWLKPGEYRLDLYILTLAIDQVVDCFEGACVLNVSSILPYRGVVPEDAIRAGLTLPQFDWTVTTGLRL